MNRRQPFLSSAILAALLSASGALVTGGTTGSEYLAHGSAPKPGPSFDGLYQGSVRTNESAALAPKDWCETTPSMRVEVRNNGLTYTMPHPNVPGNPTIPYSAFIYPDGSLQSQPGAAFVMRGRITGTHMDGFMSGMGCEYIFMADRS